MRYLKIKTLKNMISNPAYSKTKINSLLTNFKCKQNPDTADWLKTAVDKENRNESRTYLWLDTKENLIRGYVAIANKPIDISSLSATAIKRITGYKERKSVSAVLLGQIAKNDLDKVKITKKELWEVFIPKILTNINNFSPLRATVLDCSDNLVKLYSEQGFVILNKDKSNKLITMIRAEKI